MVEDNALSNPVVFTVTRRDLRWLLALVAVVLVMLGTSRLPAQRVQEKYGDKFKVATEGGVLAITTSADGRYVFIVGKRGLLVSDDYGKTGSWAQTLRMR